MTVASPCTNVCAIDAASGWCAGCLRTLDEIARWSAMHESERLRVVSDRARRAAEAARRAGR